MIPWISFSLRVIVSLRQRVQISSGALPASYPTGTRGSFPGGKATGRWSWSLTFI